MRKGRMRGPADVATDTLIGFASLCRFRTLRSGPSGGAGGSGHDQQDNLDRRGAPPRPCHCGRLHDHRRSFYRRRTDPDKSKHMIDGVRDARYCEIIPVVRHGCIPSPPSTTRSASTIVRRRCGTRSVKRRCEALRRLMVVLNGPRHFVMDAIGGSRRHRRGRDHRCRRAWPHRAGDDQGRLAGMRTKPYRERTVDRETRSSLGPASRCSCWCGRTARVTPCSPTRRSVDKSLSYADLPALGSRLKLPAGWRYDTMTPDADLILGAKGKATIVQDDLDNTYQKLD